MKHSRLKKTKFKPNKLIVLLIVLGVLILCAILGLIYYANLKTYTFTEDATYYVNGIPYQISAGDKAWIADNGVDIKFDDGFEIRADDLVVYFDERPAALSICPLAYYKGNGKGLLTGRLLPYFTEIECEYGNTVLHHELREKSGQADFLHNGEDSYIMLSSCVLSYGEEEITLPPLSYVICLFNNYIMYMDYGSREYKFIELNGINPVTAYFPQSGLTVYIDSDRTSYEGEESYMLTSGIGQLADVFR